MGHYVNNGGRVWYVKDHPDDKEMPFWKAAASWGAACLAFGLVVELVRLVF